MNKKKDIYEVVIDSGIKFLLNEQQEDGSFLSFSSKRKTDFSGSKVYHTTFITSIILSAISELEETSEIIKIKRKAAGFLLKQRSKDWSFNYWVKGSKEKKAFPYPDDLDDTFCALSALFLYDESILDGKAFAKITSLLTTLEKSEGGPYRTWVASDKSEASWKDIDLAVNSNIAYFLSLQEIQLPKLTNFIKNCILNDKISSPYYPSSYPIIYFISKFLKNSKKNSELKSVFRKNLIDKKNINLNPKNDLDTALITSSLINIDEISNNLDININKLINNSVNGSWTASVFYNDPSIKGVSYYAGSKALTTALCLEAINKYQDIYLEKIKNKNNILKENKVRNEIFRRINVHLEDLESPLKNLANDQVNLIFKRDRQIALLPYYFSKSLEKKIPDKIIVELGVGSVLGWIAYTIYDDLLDEEGDPKQISVANFSLRKLVTIFHDVLPQEHFIDFFHTVMNKVDNANAWEISNARYIFNSEAKNINNIKLVDWNKNKQKLAERSLGHILGPCAIMFSLGYSTESTEMKNLTTFFYHYLIAKQLNDDIHDWQTDFERGHPTPVVVKILEKFRTFYPQARRKNGKESLYRLQKIFLDFVVLDSCQEILDNIKIAKKEITKVSAVKYPEYLIFLLKAPEEGALRTLSEREKSMEFLKHINWNEA